MLNVRLAGDHLYGKWLFTWLSLMMPLVMSYFLRSFFPRDVLDEIWDGIESVPEDYLPTFIRIQSAGFEIGTYFREMFSIISQT